MDFIGNSQRQRPEKVPGNASGCLLNKLSEGELGSSADGYEEIKPAFSRMHIGNVNVEIADRIALELLLWLPVASDLGQPGNTVAPKASMQRRTRQMGDGRLERIKAIIERQHRMSAERDNDGFLLRRKDRRVRLLRTSRQVRLGGPLLPLGDGLLIDTVSSGKRPQALLAILYCSTDCLCRRGAAM